MGLFKKNDEIIVKIELELKDLRNLIEIKNQQITELQHKISEIEINGAETIEKLNNEEISKSKELDKQKEEIKNLYIEKRNNLKDNIAETIQKLNNDIKSISNNISDIEKSIVEIEKFDKKKSDVKEKIVKEKNKLKKIDKLDKMEKELEKINPSISTNIGGK